MQVYRRKDKIDNYINDNLNSNSDDETILLMIMIMIMINMTDNLLKLF